MHGAKWISPTEIAVVWLNRAQNVSIVSACKSPHFNCIEVITFNHFFFQNLL